MLERSNDPFWNVRAREEAEIALIQREINAITAQIDLRRRSQALQHATGFQDFLKALQNMHAVARERLVGDDTLTEAGLREMRGRVKGLEAVLALLTSQAEDKLLAERLAERKNDLATAQKRRPQPREVPT